MNRDANGNITITERVLTGEELVPARAGLSNSRGSGFAFLLGRHRSVVPCRKREADAS
ncbi:MAG: hypothetical protein ACLQFR_28600 [Streptosporangiaceae bacterium]